MCHNVIHASIITHAGCFPSNHYSIRDCSQCSTPVHGYTVTPGLQLRYQNRFSHYCPFDIHFDIFSVRNTLKCMKYISFAVNKVENLNVNFWFVLNQTLLLFCAGARLSQRARIQEISSRDDMEEAILVGIYPIKQCFCCNQRPNHTNFVVCMK